jgi:hypothetical protein
MKRFLKILLWTGGIAIIGLLIVYLTLNKKQPTGENGENAEAFAQKMALAINKVAWDSTDWVKWTYREKNHYTWDKSNGLVQVSWEDYIVLLQTADQRGTAKKANVQIYGDEAKIALDKAWKLFCNDSYWLNAPVKIFDSGVTRSIIDLDNGKKGLKVLYSSGGVTPGDSYVWHCDENGLPHLFEMWVQILPVGGLQATWEDWVTLPTGAKISTKHLIAGKKETKVLNLDAGVGPAKFD